MFTIPFYLPEGHFDFSICLTYLTTFRLMCKLFKSYPEDMAKLMHIENVTNAINNTEIIFMTPSPLVGIQAILGM